MRKRKQHLMIFSLFPLLSRLFLLEPFFLIVHLGLGRVDSRRRNILKKAWSQYDNFHFDREVAFVIFCKNKRDNWERSLSWSSRNMSFLSVEMFYCLNSAFFFFENAYQPNILFCETTFFLEHPAVCKWQVLTVSRFGVFGNQDANRTGWILKKQDPG